ncbi:MAG: hypothetical protein IKD75_06870 [Prevotella sp.]|nr:hypothetical protein [Prevotella sp.]
MKQLKLWMLAAILICGTAVMFTSCANEDNPSSSGQEETVVAPAQLKQGIWTEYDEALLTSGKYTEEQLAEMPAVGMKIEGDKAYFFTYTADDASEPVEGKISYNKSTGEGTITFPTIKDNPLSGQKVNFTATSEDIMTFELTYEGQTTTATFAWLCENLDNWSSDITDEDWKALMAYYELIAEDAGPDPSIDWSDSEVEGLDEPLVWNEDALAPAGTRAIGVGTVISVGAKILGALFEEDKPDPNKVINDKLDAITGKLNVATAKLDQALLNQENMMNQMNVQFDQINKHFDKVNERLKEISNKLDKSEAVKIFNDRNTQYYNKLKAQNPYFDKAYKLYNENKDDLSKVSADLGELATQWVDKDNGEEFLKLTWGYIDYLSTVQHSKYGIGMAKIYDGLTLEKYPWEHFGVGDRQSYRAYDMFMITRCLFMINLYATYGGLSSIKKEVIYENYDTYKKIFKEFCEFKVANPEEFLVCQIPGAHFVMHKELQKYNYKGKNNEVPHPDLYGQLAIYRPEWHEAGTVKINNPTELQSKLIHPSEMKAIYNYYRSADKAFADKNYLLWMYILVSYQDNKLVAGAKFSQEPVYYSFPYFPVLMLYEPDLKQNPINGVHLLYNRVIDMGPETQWAGFDMSHWGIGDAEIKNGKAQWTRYEDATYYAAIVEERY